MINNEIIWKLIKLNNSATWTAFCSMNILDPPIILDSIYLTDRHHGKWPKYKDKMHINLLYDYNDVDIITKYSQGGENVHCQQNLDVLSWQASKCLEISWWGRKTHLK